MEPALEQLARPLPTLSQNAGTRNPSISGEILSLAYMHPWTTFATDLSQVFEVAAPRITHQVRLLDESEVYTVGNKFGLTGRFVRNVCDPVMKSLQPLEEMESIRFGDFQAISDYENTIPDVCFGLVHKYPETTNAYLVGEFKTPLENFPACTSTRSTQPISSSGAPHRAARITNAHMSNPPSVRELLTAFSLMALKEPKYEENPEFQPRNLRGPLPTHFSSRVAGNAERQALPEQTEENIPTSQSILVDTGRPRPTVVNCVRRLTDPKNQHRATWQANMDGSPVIIKCWALDEAEPWELECEVYNRICVGGQLSRRCFANWVSRGQIVCSSIFPSGYALVLQERPGIRLDLLWRRLDDRERTHIQAEIFHGIHVLRQTGLYLNDPGQHNILYDRGSWEVTMLDFENVSQLENFGEFISDYFEMEIIFGADLSLGRPAGG
ncbi:hypothetical protein N7533_006922 [Penicillium manginii]|uniref:uncharacterized protein n=1 Tax=Penicillium manginii TaxID=203109 RepID=UPI0025493A5E|nr:uncharacterized protein N7533_006922 [Penicillium manginii]KAJ5749894.1 hypothetical protein N7533_006922 [Penicillium manginii]